MWCYTVSIKVMFKKMFYAILLLSSNNTTVVDKINYLIKLLLTFWPVAFILDQFGIWYSDNSQFAQFVLAAFSINLLVGIVYHKVMKTFSWHEFFKKNGKMLVVLVFVFTLLEMLRITIGENAIGDGIKVLFQVSTLLYPSSKALKNLYILSEKRFPPSFIMDRIYNFEKSGDLDDLTGKNKEEND